MKPYLSYILLQRYVKQKCVNGMMKNLLFHLGFLQLEPIEKKLNPKLSRPIYVKYKLIILSLRVNNMKSNLPRNKISRNTRTHKRHESQREISKKTTLLDSICEKHGVGPLTFKSCQFATSDGKISFIDPKKIQGNLKSGVMILKADPKLETLPDLVYDVVKAESDKKERDLKKKQEDEEKAREEIARLQAQNKKLDEVLPQGSKEHEALLNKLTEQSSKASSSENPIEVARTTPEETTQLTPEETTQTTPEEITQTTPETATQMTPETSTQLTPEETTQTAPEETTQTTPETATQTAPEEANQTAPVETHETSSKVANQSTLIGPAQPGPDDKKEPEEPPKPKTKRERKRDKAIKRLREGLARKAEKAAQQQGNKFYRNFMRDLKEKFHLELLPEYKYFEAKVDATEMIIVNTQIFNL